MKIPAIKKLVEQHEVNELEAAEEQLMEEQTPEITIEGADEGEQLTHVIAAIWIKNKMNEDGDEFKVALRSYTQRVRNSIG